MLSMATADHPPPAKIPACPMCPPVADTVTRMLAYGLNKSDNMLNGKILQRW